MPATPPREPTPESAGPPDAPKSLLRALAGVVSLVLSMIVIPAGFVMLVTSMRGGHFGPRVLISPLAVLSIGGGLMALGVSLLIWETSVRYGVRR
jgi:hypothetical protein